MIKALRLCSLIARMGEQALPTEPIAERKGPCALKPRARPETMKSLLIGGAEPPPLITAA